MIHNLSSTNSLLQQFVAEIRDVEVQSDRMRFRRNMERIGAVIGYEISRVLRYERRDVTTPLGTAACQVPGDTPVLCTILRAGLALHQGLLGMFDHADTAYVSAYRKHKHDGQFDIKLEYVSCPNLQDRVLIISDPMLATGSSMVLTLEELFAEGMPRETHIATAIACRVGIDRVLKGLKNVHIWAAAVDEKLDSRAYIVPGLGDAGDLAFGPKVQA